MTKFIETKMDKYFNITLYEGEVLASVPLQHNKRSSWFEWETTIGDLNP